MKKLLFISMFAAMCMIGCNNDNGDNMPQTGPDDENGNNTEEAVCEIRYTSSDGSIVQPCFEEYNNKAPFGEGVAIVSNSYENGEGVIKLNAPVKIIGTFAFSKCTNLTSIILPDGITLISDCAFDRCVSLTKIVIPNSVTTIGGAVFSNCTSLTSITIPDSVKMIGKEAFMDCTSLTTVYCESVVPPGLDRDVFSYNDYDNHILKHLTSLQAIYVPHASVEAYQASEWHDYAYLIQGYDF